MDHEMGYRNMLAVEELASQGKLTVTHKGARSFDFAQYALLSRMAWLTADGPPMSSTCMDTFMPDTS